MSTKFNSEKEFKQVVKSAKVDLKKEATSVSFWCKVIAKGVKPEIAKHLLEVEKLPSQSDVVALLVTRCLAGYKFYSESGYALICKKAFERDSNGKVVYQNEKPIIKDTWYEIKRSYTFDSVWGAIFSPSKTKVVIPEIELR